VNADHDALGCHSLSFPMSHVRITELAAAEPSSTTIIIIINIGLGFNGTAHTSKNN